MCCKCEVVEDVNVDCEQCGKRVTRHAYGHATEPDRRRNSQKRNIDSRYDGMNHVIVKKRKQTQCAQCHKNTTFRCEKCNVPLHVKGSAEYHTK